MNDFKNLQKIFTRQFSWQKFIGIYQIFTLSYDLVCQFALLGGKGLNSNKINVNCYQVAA